MTARLGDKGIGFAALAASGIAAYLFLALGGRNLGPAQFGPLGTLWSVVFLATAAVGAPLEIELARRVGAARGGGAPYASDVAAALVLAGALGSLAIASAFLGGLWIDDRLFAGATGFSMSAAVAVAGLLVGSVAKGAFAGSGRLAWWGAYLLADGASRTVLAIVASLVAPSPISFAVALALGPWLALLVVSGNLARILAGGTGPTLRVMRDLVERTSPLFLAAAASSGLIYLGAIMLPALASGPDARVGSYVAALALARMPLFVLSPLVAIAVPRIAFEIARGNSRDAARGIMGLSVLAGAAGSIMVVAAYAVGAGVLAALFGPGFALPDTSLMAVSIDAAAWLVTTAAAAGLVAAGRPRLAATGWCFGLLVAALVGWILPDPLLRTELAVTSGAVAAATTTVIALLLLVAPRRRAQAVAT